MPSTIISPTRNSRNSEFNQGTTDLNFSASARWAGVTASWRIWQNAQEILPWAVNWEIPIDFLHLDPYYVYYINPLTLLLLKASKSMINIKLGQKSWHPLAISDTLRMSKALRSTLEIQRQVVAAHAAVHPAGTAVAQGHNRPHQRHKLRQSCRSWHVRASLQCYAMLKCGHFG